VKLTSLVIVSNTWLVAPRCSTYDVLQWLFLRIISPRLLSQGAGQFSRESDYRREAACRCVACVFAYSDSSMAFGEPRVLMLPSGSERKITAQFPDGDHLAGFSFLSHY
jgi:hypothetical protein